MRAELVEVLTERFAKTAGKAIKDNAPFENVQPESVAILTAAMLRTFVLSLRYADEAGEIE